MRALLLPIGGLVLIRRVRTIPLALALLAAACGDDALTPHQDATPKFVLAWGEQGSAPGQFDLPWDVAVSADGTVYVADGRNDRVQAFSNDGVFLRAWSAVEVQAGIDGPGRIEVGPEGHVFVDGGHIAKYTPDGILVDVWERGDDDSRFRDVRDLAVDDNGFVYVASSDYIYKLDTQGNVALRWGGHGSDEGQFQLPSALAIWPDGNVVVGDRNNQRVQVFTADGIFVRAWDLTADPGAMVDVTTDSNGRTYVAHFRRSVVGRYTPGGTLDLSFGARGQGPGQFLYPTGFAWDRSGHLFVADSQNHRVQKLAVATVDNDGAVAH